jgi:DNA invertase Pin-like site-specific DNA recombinase
MSGADTNRPNLSRVLATLQPGDVLIVIRLDRLARSTRDLLNILATIGEKGAGFKSLRDSWADTTSAHGRLMLTILGGLAEFERELIKIRTSEGRERAKNRGVIRGCPSGQSAVDMGWRRFAVAIESHRFIDFDFKTCDDGLTIIVESLYHNDCHLSRTWNAGKP